MQKACNYINERQNNSKKNCHMSVFFIIFVIYKIVQPL